MPILFSIYSYGKILVKLKIDFLKSELDNCKTYTNVYLPFDTSNKKIASQV